MTMTQPAEAAAASGDPSGPRACGQLRIYLGAAPGVGKTYAMLCEAHRRVTRGTDVVAGFVETHGRAKTAALVEGLEVLPRRSIPYRGTAFEEMDTDAVIARRPQVAVVDELAHTNIPGQLLCQALAGHRGPAGRRHHRAVHRQHPASGVAQRRGPDDHGGAAAGNRPGPGGADGRAGRAGRHHPEALRRRMAHGNVYAPDKVDAALGN
jgi:two-component system sensor histidine kinase KdpD